MNLPAIRNATVLALAGAALLGSSPAGAQTVVLRTGERPAPPPSLVVVSDAAPATPPEAAVPPAAEPAVRLTTRPNRAWLATGLLLFGQAYVASIGIAATSPHPGDVNLWIPAVGPWLDLGARPGCASLSDCGTETGLRVLLVADGIVQTFGAFQLVGAFLWPETVTVPLVTTASGASFSLRPARIGRDGYGLSGVARF
jgi:hypothetical protein